MPVPGPGEVLVEVRAAGVCLSDVHLIDGSLSPGFPVDAVANSRAVTLGHEVAGVVHTLGPDVQGLWEPGQRVVLQAGQACGECGGCLRRTSCRQPLTRGVDYDGGWAQYAVAREDTLLLIPDSLPFDQAAIIPDAVSTPYAAIVGTGAVRPAQAVGIWGAGGLGAHGIRLARMVGAAPVIAVDPLASARERALAFGADIALDPASAGFAEAVDQATGGRGLQVALTSRVSPRPARRPSPRSAPRGFWSWRGSRRSRSSSGTAWASVSRATRSGATTVPGPSMWKSSSVWPPPGGSTSLRPSPLMCRWPMRRTPSRAWRRRSATRSGSCSRPDSAGPPVP